MPYGKKPRPTGIILPPMQEYLVDIQQKQTSTLRQMQLPVLGQAARFMFPQAENR